MKPLSRADEHDSQLLITSAVGLMVNHCLFLRLGIDSVIHRQSCGVFIESPGLSVPINTWIYEPVCNMFYPQLLPGGHLVESIPLIRHNSHWVLVNLRRIKTINV